MNLANNSEGSKRLLAEASTSVLLEEVAKKNTKHMKKKKKKKEKEKHINKKKEKKKKKEGSKTNNELVICNYHLFLHLVFEYLPVRDLITARLVCKAWHERFEPPSPTTTWLCKQLLLVNCEFAHLPNTTSAEFLRKMYLVRKRLKKKISRLVWDRGDMWPSMYYFRKRIWENRYTHNSMKIVFLDDLVWAVRILYCQGPSKAYLTMHGIDEFTPFNPTVEMQKHNLLPHWEGTMEDGDTYNLNSNSRDEFLFGTDACCGLEVLKILKDRGRGGSPGQVKYFLLGHHHSVTYNENWSKATDLVEHTKLLSFLMRHDDVLLALIWNVFEVVYLGVERLASREEAISVWSAVPRYTQLHNVAAPHFTQLLCIFKIMKLAQHVEALSWEACCYKPLKNGNASGG